jgi:YfiH family protein
MPFHQTDGVRYLTFNIFPAGLAHAVFTRHGGVSPEPWGTLNVGGTVGDDRPRVIENRQRAFRALNRDPQSLFDVWQVHSADVIIANAPRPHGPPQFKADAIITDNPQVTLFMRFADCVPILLYDPRRGAAGIVHAGWQGTVRRAASHAVKAMHAAYGSHPADILAAIGPSIGPDHYQVGADVTSQVRASFGQRADGLLHANGQGLHLDLWSANRLDLEEAGVGQVEVAGLCTACQRDDWFSHRAFNGRTGRFGALVALL